MVVGTKVIVCLLLASAVVAADDDDGPVVEMALGKVRGLTALSRGGKEYMFFRSLAYAEPPVGELRLQPPKKLTDTWRGIKDARAEQPTCVQGNPFMNMSFAFTKEPSIGVEDCLYLSVATHSVTGKSPVLVHFHGGAFTVGAASFYKPDYLMDEDVVVVNANYRVGILGFLSFENSDLPGNLGMKDQVMALKWVQRNIASFGGDPTKVTIIGESAGGASVYHHIVSPMSRGLFHGGISESGTSYSLWALAPPGFARSRAEKLMDLIGCPKDSKNAIPCVIKKDASELASKINDFLEFQSDPLQSFGPCIEAAGPDAFLVGPINKWDHNPVPLLISMTSAEGLFRTLILLAMKTDFKWLSENFNKIAPVSLGYFGSASKPAEITNKVREYYLPKPEISMSDWVNLTAVYSDSWFTTSVIDGANKHKGDVYFYYFDYIIDTGLFFGPIPKDLNIGADHVTDSHFIWKNEFPGMKIPKPKDDGIALSKRLIKLIADFMKFGNPAPKGSDLTWPKWTSKSNNYVQIDNKGFHVKKGLAEDRYKFWNSINYRDNYDNTISKNILKTEL